MKKVRILLGYIRDKLYFLVKKQEEYLKRALDFYFNKVDTDKNGVVTVPEFMKLALSFSEEDKDDNTVVAEVSVLKLINCYLRIKLHSNDNKLLLNHFKILLVNCRSSAPLTKIKMVPLTVKNSWPTFWIGFVRIIVQADQPVFSCKE